MARYGLAGGSLRLVSFLSGNRLGLAPDNLTGGTGTAAAGMGTTLGWASSSAGMTWTRLSDQGDEARVRAWYAGSSADIAWLPEWGSAQLHSTVSELGVSVEAGRESARGSHLVGASLVRPATAYSVTQLSSNATVASGTSSRFAAPSVASLFTEWSWRPTTRFVARGGIRANAALHGEFNLEPRVDVTVHTSPTTHFDFGVGRTHQTLQSMFNEENLLGTMVGLELPTSASGALPTATADQIGIGVEHRVTDRLFLTFDSYARRWTGVPLPATTTGGLFVTDSVYIGTGHAEGVVLGAALNGRRLAAHASLSFSQSVRQYAGLAYHAGVERPWGLAGAVDYRIDRRTAAQLAFNTGAGTPSSITGGGADTRPDHLTSESGDVAGTPVNLPGPVNVERLPGYSRLDLGIRRNWPVTLAGRGGALSTTLRVINLLDTSNGIGVVASSGSSLRIVRGTPRSLAFELGWVF